MVHIDSTALVGPHNADGAAGGLEKTIGERDIKKLDDKKGKNHSEYRKKGNRKKNYLICQFPGRQHCRA
jgi:hypothetical protein